MPNATATKPIEVLKPGVHVDANGIKVEFTETDLQAIADNYDPALHEAPFVVGHPKMDAPAYGWSRRFTYKDGLLFAEGQDVEEQFAGLVKDRRFSKISLSLYGPKAPGNPKPGVWYPRHVGFLGAMPPAIKGLKSVEFADAEEGVHEFSDSYATSSLVRMMRGLRDWMLTQFGQETADKVLPSYELDYVTESLAADRVRESIESTASVEGISPAFVEASAAAGGGDQDMSNEQAAALQAQLDAARQRAEQAEQQLQARRDADAAAENQRREAVAVAFAERMVGEARVPAERRDQVVAIHMALTSPNTEGTVLSFGEGEAQVSAAAVFEQLISTATPSVQFGETALTGRDVSDLDDVEGQVQFAEGANLDAERLALHQDAVRFQREQKGKGREVDYLSAVHAVRGNRR